MPAPSPPGTHVFVDETKARSFLLVAVVIAPSELSAARQAMRALVPSGHRRVHFKKLTDRQRARVVQAVAGLDVSVVVARSAERRQAVARSAAMTALARQLRAQQAARVVVERDDFFVAADLATLRAALPSASVDHLAGAAEPMLWVSDAVAWCLQRRDGWRLLVADLVVADLDADT